MSLRPARLMLFSSAIKHRYLGVVVGGQYTNSSGQLVQGQYIPALASTAANPAVAYVVDDQQALFKVAVVTSGTTMGTASRADVGSNVALVLNAGSTTTGDSAFGPLIFSFQLHIAQVSDPAS